MLLCSAGGVAVHAFVRGSERECLQLIGQPYKEEALVAVGAALDSGFGFRWPPLARETRLFPIELELLELAGSGQCKLIRFPDSPA